MDRIALGQFFRTEAAPAGSIGNLRLGARRETMPRVALTPPITDGIACRVTALPEMLDRLDEWRRLGDEALEPNVFQEASFCSTAALHQPAGPTPQFLVIESRKDGNATLIGVLPFRQAMHDAATRTLRSWCNKQIALGTPIFHRSHAAEAVDALLAWLQRDAPASKLLFRQMRLDGPTFQLIKSAITARGMGQRLFSAHQRALLQSLESGHAYMQHHWRAKKLKELRRLRHRLSDLGPVDFRLSSGQAEISADVERFLALEAQGWKGHRGMALIQESGRATFARAMLRELEWRDRLSVYTLECAGETVAIGLVLHHGETAYFWKLAIDERRAAFSPGVLFVQSLTEALLARPDVGATDSCATSNHPMIDHLWKERRPIGDLLVAAFPRRPDFWLLCAKESGLRKLRVAVKAVITRWRGESRQRNTGTP
jgi:CelD/BcsL family acetyltransferase involved in cellulose biosynthesis